MITTTEVKDRLKEIIACDVWYTNGVRDNVNELIAVYGDPGYTNPRAIGTDSSYYGKGIRILVRWNKNAHTAELKANEVYQKLRLNELKQIKDKRVIDVKMKDAHPVFLGVVDGNFEYVISCELILER